MPNNKPHALQQRNHRKEFDRKEIDQEIDLYNQKNSTHHNTEEHYYTLKEYQKSGLELLLEHIKDYFNKIKTTPVSKTSSIHTNEIIFFTFSDSLLELFLYDPNKLKKAYKVAIKYGFRGHTKGGKNGIFYQRKTDINMINRTRNLAKKHKDEIIRDLNTNNLEALSLVKIVYHDQSGERIVGLYNQENNRIIFLDFATY